MASSGWTGQHPQPHGGSGRDRVHMWDGPLGAGPQTQCGPPGAWGGSPFRRVMVQFLRTEAGTKGSSKT